MMNYVCILCGSKKHKYVFLRDELKVVKCSACGLVFQCSHTINKSDTYYVERSTLMKNPDTFRKRRMQFILNRMKKLHGQAEKILDVGSGWGHFIEILKSNYKKIVGVEPNKQQANYLISKNLEVYPNLYTIDLFDKDKFDIVSFIQVLEHLPNPIEAVKASYKHLKKNGILVIDVPSYNNPRFLIYRMTRNKYIVKNDFIKPHLYYFTPSTLRMVCETAGFEIIHSDIGQYSVKCGIDNTIFGNFLDRLSKILHIGSITIYAKKQ